MILQNKIPQPPQKESLRNPLSGKILLACSLVFLFWGWYHYRTVPNKTPDNKETPEIYQASNALSPHDIIQPKENYKDPHFSSKSSSVPKEKNDAMIENAHKSIQPTIYNPEPYTSPKQNKINYIFLFLVLVFLIFVSGYYWFKKNKN